MITSDLNPLNYRMHILMNGISDALNFQIDQSIAEHLQLALKANNATARFFCFSCKDGTRIALSIEDIRLVHYLWETGSYIDNKSESEAKVELQFRDRSEPYSAYVEDYDEIDGFEVSQDTLDTTKKIAKVAKELKMKRRPYLLIFQQGSSYCTVSEGTAPCLEENGFD